MNDLMHIPSGSLPVPAPRVPVSIRVATIEDLPFMDALQKKYGKALGYFPRKQFEEYINSQSVLIAEDPLPSPPPEYRGREKRLGYVISKDRYLKRDELGVVYQLCVVLGAQRKLVGAALLREVFARSAYGCRLFCCWCAQDLAANYFWESMGFVPLAFRAGSDRKKRVHIFWQKRICEGDEGQGGTPWWYPFKTDQGALRADRAVFPIPPGVGWREVEPVDVPTGSTKSEIRIPKQIPNLKSKIQNKAKPSGPGPGKVGILVGGRIKYVDRPGYVAPVPPAVAPLVPLASAPGKSVARERKPVQRIDAGFLAKARELRDRWLECVNSGTAQLPAPVGKYDVTRMLSAAPTTPLLAA
jgi:hypothetical protein